jgi:hypothetical protein
LVQGYDAETVKILTASYLGAVSDLAGSSLSTVPWLTNTSRHCVWHLS